MGRIALQKPNNKNNASSSSGVRGGKVQKQRKKHKVVIESAGSKDDDKLRVVLSFHAEPPPGYTFIPAGNTQLTLAMKNFAKRGGHQIMAVSATPHAQRHELSREVHRIGYHFPTEIVAQVCSHYGIRLDSSGRLIGEHDSEKLFMRISQKGQVVLNENIRDQVTINTEAKEIIRDLFPRIPDNDLFQIIKTAFQLGDNKVGTAEEIPLVRRAQLSVVAHIRHSYTNYDRLLRQLPYNEARHTVEKPTLAKLVEWRGDENDKTEESRRAVDDAVREVVVLSDEESSESEIEEGQVIESSNMKVEPVQKSARPAVITEHRPVSPGDLSSAEEAPQGYRYVPRTSKKNLITPMQADVVAREQQSRYALWDQVRHEYQAGVYSQEPPRIIARIPLENPVAARHEPMPRDVLYEPIPPVRYVVEDPQPVRVFRQPSPPLFHGPDGKLYERVMPRPQEGTMPVRRIYTPPTGHAFAAPMSNRRSASPRAQRPQYHRRTPSTGDDGPIVQSIETPDSAYKSPGVKSRPFDGYNRPERSVANHSQRPNRLIDLTSSAEQATERMRISPSPPPSPYLQRPSRAVRDVDMIDENHLPRRRQLIELDHQIPTPASSQRSDYGQQDSIRSRHEYIPPARGQMIEDRSTFRQSYQQAPQTRVIYEAVDDRPYLDLQVRYVAEQPPEDRVEQRYYLVDDRPVRHLPPQDPYSRRIVLDATVPMQDIRRPADQRHQPAYRTTYVQQ